MFCQACGSKLEDGVQVCCVCGTSVNPVVVSESQHEKSLAAIENGKPNIEENKQQLSNLKQLSGENLYQKLIILLEPLEKIEYLDEKLVEERKKYKRIGSHCTWYYFWPFLIFGWYVGLMISGMISLIIMLVITSLFGNNIDETVFNYMVVILAVFVILLIMGVGLAISISASKKSKEKADKNKNIVSQRISEMENTQTELYLSIKDILDMVPQDYRYYIAINYFVECLRKGRADTMKEAVNLYEEQMHRWKLENAAMQAVALQRQQVASLRNIQVSSNVAATASTINTIYNIMK